MAEHQPNVAERIAQYPKVANAQATATEYYGKAKESNEYVKNALEAGEGLFASGSAAVWPYLQPAIERVQPAANDQLDYLEKKIPEATSYVTQTYSDYKTKAEEAYSHTSAGVQTKTADVVRTLDSSVDYYLPAQGTEEEEEAIKDATAEGAAGQIFLISQKLSTRLYERAASNVSYANAYTRSLPAKKDASIAHFLEVVEKQKTNLTETIASTQAYVLSSVQGAGSTASAKLDEFRSTAAGQTALDIRNNLISTLTSLKDSAAATAADYKVPETITETANSLSDRLSAFYKEVRAGDDKLRVTERLTGLAEEARKTWDTLYESIGAYVPATKTESL
eukprot:CFRG0415T1